MAAETNRLRYLRQLGQESLVYGLAGVVSKFIGFFLVPIYTRIFSPADYGVMGLITTTMAAVSIFVVLGLDSAAGRWYYDSDEIEDRKRTIATWAVTQVTVAVFFGLLIFLFAQRLYLQVAACGYRHMVRCDFLSGCSRRCDLACGLAEAHSFARQEPRDFGRTLSRPTGV